MRWANRSLFEMPKKGMKKGKARREGGRKKQGSSGGGGGSAIKLEPRRNDTDIAAKWMPIFPDRTSRKLRYSSSFYLAGTSGVVASNVLAANGLYDPDITGSGHQPMGFDQLMLSYNHYTVTSCRLQVTFHNLSASTPTVSLKVDGGATPSTVVDTILEFGMNTHSVLEAKSTFGAVKVLECGVSIRKFEGVKDVMDVIDLRGSVSANPAELTYFHVQCWDNSGTTTNVLCEIIMEFQATFSEPRTLTPSLTTVLKEMLLSEDKKEPHSVTEALPGLDTYDFYSSAGKWVAAYTDPNQGHLKGFACVKRERPASLDVSHPRSLPAPSAGSCSPRVGT